jgi:membrane protease YdiL (CAAX protease family)
LLIYLAVVFLGGALLAPWLWQLAQTGAQHFPSLQNTAAQPFHRYLHRALLALALLGLWPLVRQLGLRHRRDLGLVRFSGNGKNLLTGLTLGFGSLALVIGFALFGHAREFSHDLTAALLAKAFFKAATTAAVVALLEEILFRGGVFGGLRRVLNWQFALGLSSGVFALVHFFQRAELVGAVNWSAGLRLLPAMLAGFLDVQKLLPGFGNLALVGALLALAYQRSGNLWLGIGLHAGWIFWLKFSAVVTPVVPGARVWFWGSSQLIDGWLTLGALLLVLALSGKLFPAQIKTSRR